MRDYEHPSSVQHQARPHDLKVTVEQGKRPYYSTMGWPVIRTRVISIPSTLFLLLITRKQASQFKNHSYPQSDGSKPIASKTTHRTGSTEHRTAHSSASSASSVTRVHLSFPPSAFAHPVYPPSPSRPLSGAVPQPWELTSHPQRRASSQQQGWSSASLLSLPPRDLTQVSSFQLSEQLTGSSGQDDSADN